jgi:hypothetical protein
VGWVNPTFQLQWSTLSRAKQKITIKLIKGDPPHCAASALHRLQKPLGSLNHDTLAIFATQTQRDPGHLR